MALGQPVFEADVEEVARDMGRGVCGGETSDGRRAGIERVEGAFGGGGS